MMVLHNLFFLVLAASVYFTVIPLVESHVNAARAREFSLLRKVFLEDPMPQVPGQAYRFQEGVAPALGIPPAAVNWLELHPGQIYDDPNSTMLYRLVPSTGVFRSVETPEIHYESVVRRAKITIFVVLGILYGLAILLLELTIMPRYVYGPIRRFLQADAAAQAGDRRHELIPDPEILDDEIGEIMRSRNATVAELRKQEEELAEAMARLETSRADLQSKNEQLEAARRSLMEQDRLASLGLLSASVAHELNTPLAVLTGSIEKLVETAEAPIMRERLARMKRVTARIKQISENLLDFARERKQASEPVVLRAVIDEAWALLAMDEKSAAVDFRNLVNSCDRAFGNAGRLTQVFLNLLRNALNAVGERGAIQASSREVREGGQAWLVVAVEDNGPGIPAEVLPDIFEAFVTTRLDAQGTGLGLTVAEGIVSQHGGTIAAFNRQGGGAVLEVRLPAAPSIAASVPAASGE